VANCRFRNGLESNDILRAESRDGPRSANDSRPVAQIALAAALLTAALAGLTLPAGPAQTQVARISDHRFSSISENNDCSGPARISVQLDGTQARDTTVHVFAITRSGLDMFRDSPGRLHPTNTNNTKISGGGPVTIPAGSTNPVPTGICWRDDVIHSGSSASEVMVVIANGPGYTVSPDHGRINLEILNDDFCGIPPPGGVVYRESGCRCATESLHPSARRQTSPEPRDGQSGKTWRQHLQAVAGHFSDPSYLYCADSPYKGLPRQHADAATHGTGGGSRPCNTSYLYR